MSVKRDMRQYPLRKIVSYEGAYDVLECGHKMRQAEDIFGPRNPSRRRCRHCPINTKGA